MALTESNAFTNGTLAPEFSLPDTVSGKTLSLQQLKGEKGTVVMFICNHCPYVVYLNEAIVDLAKDYQKKGIGFIAISSNDVENYPQDGPLLMKAHALKLGYTFPYLYDETQEVARAYDAACTPDFYVFDAELKATYHGQFDGSRPGNAKAITGTDIRSALDAVLENKPALALQKPSMGCNIKWK